jgi:hypothetical protein
MITRQSKQEANQSLAGGLARSSAPSKIVPKVMRRAVNFLEEPLQDFADLLPFNTPTSNQPVTRFVSTNPHVLARDQAVPGDLLAHHYQDFKRIDQLDGKDYGQFANYLRLHNWVNNYTWSASSSPDGIIATIPIHPQYCNMSGTPPAAVTAYVTPLGYAGLSACQWRGSLTYVIQVFCPKGVTGSLRFTHHPQVPGATPAPDPPSVGQCLSTVIAVDGDTTTSVAVPYTSIYPLLDTVDYFTEANFASATTSAGSLEISVAGPLVNLYGIAVDVNINIWMIPGPDFVYYIPKRQPLYDVPVISRQSATSKTQATGVIDPNTRPDKGNPSAMTISNLVTARDVFYSPITSWYDLLTYPLQFETADFERNIYDVFRANSNKDFSTRIVGGLWQFPFQYFRGNFRMFGNYTNISLGHLSGDPQNPTVRGYGYSIPNFVSIPYSYWEVPFASRFPFTPTDYTNPLDDRFLEFTNSVALGTSANCALSDNMQFFWPTFIDPIVYTAAAEQHVSEDDRPSVPMTSHSKILGRSAPKLRVARTSIDAASSLALPPPTGN